MRPSQIPAGLEALATHLIEVAGIPATVDAALAQLPGAFITIGDLDAALLSRGWISATAKVHLLAQDTGQTYALTQLMDMLEKVQKSGLIPTSVEAIALNLPSLGTVPALTVSVSLED